MLTLFNLLKAIIKSDLLCSCLKHWKRTEIKLLCDCGSPGDSSELKLQTNISTQTWDHTYWFGFGWSFMPTSPRYCCNGVEITNDRIEPLDVMDDHQPLQARVSRCPESPDVPDMVLSMGPDIELLPDVPHWNASLGIRRGIWISLKMSHRLNDFY